MDIDQLSYAEIIDINDDLLLPWIELYETAFPAPERLLIATQLRLIKNKMNGISVNQHTLAILNGQEEFVGLLQYEVVPDSRAAFLWYFAVVPELRSQGLGMRIYRELWNRLQAEGGNVLVFEVEIPEEAESENQRFLAEKRIAFYHRQGARLLKGTHHIQEVGPHQQPIPMHVMVDSREVLDPRAAFMAAQAVLGDSVSEVGVLSLE